MQRRTLGRTSIAVSRIGLGCVTFGREIDERGSFAVLDCALESGITLLDTAEAYGGGQSLEARRPRSGCADVREATQERHSSELILGRWLAARRCRERVVLQTKVTPPLNRVRMLQSLDDSLRRLQTDYVDVFLLHAFDTGTPLADTLAALAEVIRSGKARVVGCSNFTGEQMIHAIGTAHAHGLGRLDILQVNYNLAVRDPERSLFDLCREHGVAIETYSPLAAGFLTGKYNSLTRRVVRGSRFDVVPGHADIYFHDENFRLVDRLMSLAAAVGIPATQLALAWVLQRPDVDAVLFGARHPGHIQNALDASRVRFNPAWNTYLVEGDCNDRRPPLTDCMPAV